MKDVTGKNIVVAGAARSGVSAAILLSGHGATVFVTDAGPVAEHIKERLNEFNISFEEKGHTGKAEEGDFLVISPGIPSDSDIAISYSRSGRKIYSELEAASWFNENRMIAVTGSNGKTTVATWLNDIWECAGLNPHLAGNIGTAFSDVVTTAESGSDILLEVSSFQLDHIDTFRPAVSLILNITPDHLNRYENSFEKYAKAKFRITENQTSDDWFIYDADDSVLTRFSKTLSQKDDSPRQLAFSLHKEVEEGLFLKDGALILKLNQKRQTLMEMNDVSLPGNHNLKNGMAAALAARACEISNDTIRESLKRFEGVEHRLELVRVLNGVSYINDSKATNINAVWYALDSFNMPIVLILGGRDKGNNYSELQSQLVEKVHTIIAIGEAKEAIKSQLNNVVPDILDADSLEQAVELSRKKAKRGEIVLLSPACSSFDMFKNYEERGNCFKDIVNQI
jgi:UDP-N-acetylmuramoylalanine--D-glutamate ligase